MAPTAGDCERFRTLLMGDITVPPWPSLPTAAVHQFLDVVHQAEQLPLRAHLAQAPEREAAQPLVVPKVGEHRLHGGDAPAGHASHPAPLL